MNVIESSIDFVMAERNQRVKADAFVCPYWGRGLRANKKLSTLMNSRSPGKAK